MSNNLNRSLSSSYLTSLSRWSIALSLTLSTFLATQSLPLAHAQSSTGPTSSAAETANYNPKFKAKSEEIKNWFNAEMETVRNSYVLTRFVDQYLQAKEGEVTCKQLGDFQYALSPEDQRTLIEEVDHLTKKPGSPTAYACPFVSRDSLHANKNVTFYNTLHGRLLNFLELVAFAKTNNADWLSL